MIKESWKGKQYIEMAECIFRKRNRIGIIWGVQGKQKSREL